METPNHSLFQICQKQNTCQALPPEKDNSTKNGSILVQQKRSNLIHHLIPFPQIQLITLLCYNQAS